MTNGQLIGLGVGTLAVGGLAVAGLLWALMRDGAKRLEDWDSAVAQMRRDDDMARAAAAELEKGAR